MRRRCDHKDFEILYGEDVDVAFLAKINPVDQACYDPKYWGEDEATVLRYVKNRKSFVFVMDKATGDMAGYVNFFPCEHDLYIDNLWRSPVIRDDDILPAEVAPWRHDENHVFIISLCVHPNYQGTDVIKLLSDGFIDYLCHLRDDLGFPITDIMGTTVSQHGRKAMRNYLFREVRTLKDGDVVYMCDGARLEKFLDHDLYFKSYRDDVYLLIPLAEHEDNLRMKRILEQRGRRVGSSRESAARPAQDGDSAGDAGAEDCQGCESDETGESLSQGLIDDLDGYLAYECDNAVVREMDLVDLGEFDFLHTTDEYEGPMFGDDGEPDAAHSPDTLRWTSAAERTQDDEAFQEVVLGDVRAHAVLAAHRKTHMFVLTVLLPDYPFSTSQLEDQISYGYLKIRNPQNPAEYVPLYEYLLKTYGLHGCGQPKCVTYLSRKPRDAREFEDILAAEAFNSYEDDLVLTSPEIREMAATNRAQYADYEVYLSSRAIAYVAKEFSDSPRERVADFADYLFIVIVTLFQNTALAKVNIRVTNLLETKGAVTPQTKLAIDEEYGRTVRFWEMQNFRYLPAQLESAVIREAFLNQELKEAYDEHQAYLGHVVEASDAIADNRNGMIINWIATVLAVIEVQPVAVEVLQGFYRHLGIEATYASSTFNFGVFGILALILLVVIINRRRIRNNQRGRM